MSELQATIEVQVELSKFYNIDLFQRGYYQVRTSLKLPLKAPAKVEVSLPRNSDNSLVFPASINNGVAVSKMFQILYRNEDVQVNDVMLFKVHTLVDAAKIEESLDNLEMQLNLDLWFTEEEFGGQRPEQQEKLQCISQRVLKMNFTSSKGLHHHVPLLFDYFHLSAVCVTVHASLIMLHQPYMNLRQDPKQGGWVRPMSSSFESVLFGPRPNIQASNRYMILHRLQHGRQMYRQLCQVLLSAYESLQESFTFLTAKLSAFKDVQLETKDCQEKLEELCKGVEHIDNEEDFLQTATSDVAQLCGANVILWRQYLDVITLNNKILAQLSKDHHNQRVKRFAEGFFTFEFPKNECLACHDQELHGHTDLANLVKTSDYFTGLLPLALECWDMDGDHTTLPIIFEDVYAETPISKIFTTGSTEEEQCDTPKKSRGSPTSLARKNSKTSHSSGTASPSSSSSLSPRQRQRRSLIKNLKPDAFKRPSSFMVEEGRRPTGQVAGQDRTDCTLVGYRKINAEASFNTDMYLGTFTTPEPELDLSKVSINQDLLSPKSPGLSGSMPELSTFSEKGIKRNDSSKSDEAVPPKNNTVATSKATQSQAAAECLNRSENASTGETPTQIPQENETCAIPSMSKETADEASSTVDDADDSSLSSTSLQGIENGYVPSDNPPSSSSPSHSSNCDSTTCGLESMASPTLEIQPADLLGRDKSQPGRGCTVMELLKQEYVAAHPEEQESAKEKKDNDKKTPVSLDDVKVLEKSLGRSASVKSSTGNTENVSKDKLVPKQFSNLGTIAQSSSTPELSSIHRQDKQGKLVSPVHDTTINFITAKENLRKQLRYNGHLYSDFMMQASLNPYFQPVESSRHSRSDDGIHLIICVHGLDGNSADLRLVRTYLEMAMPEGRYDFLMSERNQPDTFADLDVMTDNLVSEILYHLDIYGLDPQRISFVGHSLGNLIIRSALARPKMAPLLPKLYTLLSLSGPHLGMLYNSSGLVNMGMWFMQKWKKSGSLLQLSLKDHPDPRQSFIYKLSQKAGLEFFKNILLVGSAQDRYVPFHSSRIEICRAAVRDVSPMGAVYLEMANNILQPIVYKSDINFIRYDVFHALPNTANSLIGRAAHIAVLDSEIFIEKFITVAALKYFK